MKLSQVSDPLKHVDDIKMYTANSTKYARRELAVSS